MRKLVMVLNLLMVSIMLIGCATINSVNDTWRKNPGRAQVEILNNKNIDEVTKAVKEAVFNLGLAFEGETVIDKSRVIYARSAANLSKAVWTGRGYGELIGVFLTSVDNHIKIEVVVQKAYKIEVGFTDYRGLILNQVKSLLKI